VTLEEFNEFRRSLEERLDAIERKLDDFVKAVNEKHTRTQVEVEELSERIGELSESSRGFVDRLREALRPRAAEPMKEQARANPVGETERTIGRVADVIMRCPNFFDWDWCQDNCPMYVLCDDISSVQDISKLPQEDSIGRFKGLLKRLEDSFNARR